MRKLAAILLGGMFLFNWIGYRVLNNYMQFSSVQQLETRLNKQQYDESQLISIKIPVTELSYYNNSTAFERVDGHIEINGIPYQYVKRRIYKDSLELLCIPNQKAMKLKASGANHFKLVNEIERSEDPYTVIEPFQLSERPFTVVVRSYFYAVNIPSASHTTEERPPDNVRA